MLLLIMSIKCETLNALLHLSQQLGIAGVGGLA